jgi:hypothetical protein
MTQKWGFVYGTGQVTLSFYKLTYSVINMFKCSKEKKS